MTWKHKAKAIAAKHSWGTEDFFQCGVSRVSFVRRIPGVLWPFKVMSIEFDRRLTDRMSEEQLWKGLCQLYFSSVPDAASEAEITLAAEVSSDGC